MEEIKVGDVSSGMEICIGAKELAEGSDLSMNN